MHDEHAPMVGRGDVRDTPGRSAAVSGRTRYSRDMPRRFFLFEDPDRFVAGTVGRPGQRTFFLQALQGGRIASVALEKVQVAVLADRVAAILAELERRGVKGASDVAVTSRAPSGRSRPRTARTA